jgi:hypothetical protein
LGFLELDADEFCLGIGGSELGFELIGAVGPSAQRLDLVEQAIDFRACLGEFSTCTRQ